MACHVKGLAGGKDGELAESGCCVVLGSWCGERLNTCCAGAVGAMLKHVIVVQYPNS